MGSLDFDRDPILVLDFDRWSSSLALDGLETDRVFVESPPIRRDPDLPVNDVIERDGGTPWARRSGATCLPPPREGVPPCCSLRPPLPPTPAEQSRALPDLAAANGVVADAAPMPSPLLFLAGGGDIRSVLRCTLLKR